MSVAGNSTFTTGALILDSDCDSGASILDSDSGASILDSGTSILNLGFISLIILLLSSNICELRELHKFTVWSMLPDARSGSVG